MTASRAEEPELFWALCGAGGGSLGVVVEMTMALAPVDEVYAGNLFYPLDAARDVFGHYLDWVRQNPEDLTSAFNITSFPPLEVVPEPLRGQAFAIVRGAHCGDLADGARRIDEWRRWREPLMDMWRPMPFTRCAEISQDPVDPVPAASTGRWLASAGSDTVEVMLEAVAGGDRPSPMLFAELRHAGGAIARANPAVSFGARDAAFSFELVGMVTGPDADDDLEQRFAQAWQRLSPQMATQQGYLNFVEGHERIEMARHAFDAPTRQRLSRVKQAIDPAGVFCHGLDLTGRSWDTGR